MKQWEIYIRTNHYTFTYYSDQDHKDLAIAVAMKQAISEFFMCDAKNTRVEEVKCRSLTVAEAEGLSRL